MEFDEEGETSQSEQQPDNNNKTNTTAESSKKPQPLVAHGTISEHKDLVNKVKDLVQDKFYITYHSNSTEVFTATETDYQLLKDVWEQEKLPFHTYTQKGKQIMPLWKV